MRDYGTIPTQFWLEPNFQTLSNEARLLAVYLLSGPHTNMLGCFRLPAGYIAEDLKWCPETVAKGFRELSRVGFLTRENGSNWLVLHGFLKWNPIENPNQAKSLIKLFELVPAISIVFPLLINTLLEHCQHFPELFSNRLQTLSQQFRNQDQDQEQDQKQVQDQEGCAELQGNSAPNDPPAPPVITIPLHDKTEFVVTETMVSEWQGLYPATDVIQALRNIRGWNLANPKKRKTKQGVLKHITHWLANDQDRGGSSNHAMPRYTPPARGAALHDRNLAVAEQWLQQNQGTVIDGEIIYAA